MSARPLFYGFPRLIGHRGARGLAPENTLAGLDAARGCGLDWVEIDVRLTRDGQCVLSHDPAIAAPDGPGGLRIAAHDWESLRARLPAMPGLGEALAHARKIGLGVNVELKSEGERNPLLASRALADIAAQTAPSGPPVLVSSFSAALVAHMAVHFSALPRALIVTRAGAPEILTARRLGCVSLHIANGGASPGVIAATHRARLRYAVYTVNTPARARRLFAAGADGLFTDRPDLLSDV